MLDALIAQVGATLETSPYLALVAVFAGGALTASSPCVLAMIPLTMSFVAGQRDHDTSVGRAFGFSLVFVLGLATTFVVLGMVAALAGSVYGDISRVWTWVVAIVCIVMGLHLAEVFSLPIPTLAGRIQPQVRGMLGALVLGLFFGVVSAPCAAPLLVVLLTYLAGAGASVAYGGVLLLVYALGHSLLILVAGTSMGAARVLLENKKMVRALALLRRSAGAVVVLVGVYFALRGFA